jgi:hypothetical protein
MEMRLAATRLGSRRLRRHIRPPPTLSGDEGSDQECALDVSFLVNLRVAAPSGLPQVRYWIGAGLSGTAWGWGRLATCSKYCR